MQGLAPKTLKILDRVSALNSIQGFWLVGGTGIAIQVNHRLSEDLDFCKWVPKSNVNNAISVKIIERELLDTFGNVRTNHLSFDQVDFQVEGVKLTFFNEVGLNPPAFEPISYIRNIYGVPLYFHGAMKVKTMFERITYRDYYDLYVLIYEGHMELKDLIIESIRYQPRLDTAMILKRLSAWEMVKEESGFTHLSPKYSIGAEAIGSFFIERIKML